MPVSTALRHGLPRSCKDVEIQANEFRLAPGLRLPAVNMNGDKDHDNLSWAIATATSRVRDLRYSGMLDHSIFWSEGGWQILEVLLIRFALRHHSGQYYIHRPFQQDVSTQSGSMRWYRPPGQQSRPGEDTDAAALRWLQRVREHNEQALQTDDEDDDDNSENEIFIYNEDLLVPLLKGWGEALQRAPAVRRAELSTRLAGKPWFVWYMAPGTESGYESYVNAEDPLRLPRVFLYTHQWVVPSSVLEIFETIRWCGTAQDTVITVIPFGKH